MLSVTVPKRKRKKRKKRQADSFRSLTSEPQQDGSEEFVQDAQYLLNSMKDCSKRYQVNFLGTIKHTHRFRSLPDFVQSSANSPFIQKMKDTILTFDFENIKRFKLDMSKGVKPNTEIIPPPSWSHLSIPFNYSYRQNPGVKTIMDSQGNLVTRNTQLPPKIYSPTISFDSPVVPSGPAPELPPLSSLEPAVQDLVTTMKRLIEDRPIFTRRSLPNCIPGDEWENLGQNVGKFLFQYVGYMFNSGPWRDAIIRFGVDPRLDFKYRIYQTMMFVVDREPKSSKSKLMRRRHRREKTEQELRKESHLFDGVNVSPDGKIWQVCDVTDALLKDLLATQNLRDKCHTESDGWYHNGTWSKVRTIMRYKIAAILSGTGSLSDADYARVAAGMPDIIKKNDKGTAKLTYENPTLEERALATSIRSACSHYRMEEGTHRAARESYGNEVEKYSDIESDPMDEGDEERNIDDEMQSEEDRDYG